MQLIVIKLMQNTFFFFVDSFTSSSTFRLTHRKIPNKKKVYKWDYSLVFDSHFG